MHIAPIPIPISVNHINVLKETVCNTLRLLTVGQDKDKDKDRQQYMEEGLHKVGAYTNI